MVLAGICHKAIPVESSRLLLINVFISHWSCVVLKAWHLYTQLQNQDVDEDY